MKKTLLICLLLVSALVSNASAESTWTKIGLSGGNVTDIESFPSNPDIMLACVSGNGMYRSTDRGDHWTQINTKTSVFLTISESDVAYVADGNEIVASHDFGETWTTISDLPATQILFAQDGIMAARDVDNRWNLSYDNGETWEQWAGTDNIRSLLFHSDGSVYGMIGLDIYRAVPDDWETWELMETFSDPYVPYLYLGISVGDSAVYAYSEYFENHPGPSTLGGVYRSLDDGETWNLITSTDFSATGLFRYEHIIIAVYNTKLYYAPLNMSPIRQFGSFSAEITAVDLRRHGSGETIVSTRGGIYKTTDGGATWNRSDNGIMTTPTGSVQVVPLADESERIVISTPYNGILYSDDNGGSWIAADQGMRIPPGLLKAAPSNPQRMYAGGDFLYMSDDYGETWVMIEDVPFHQYNIYCNTHDIDIDPWDHNHIGVHYEPNEMLHNASTCFSSGRYTDSWEWSELSCVDVTEKFQFDSETEYVWRLTNYHHTKMGLYNYDRELIKTFDLPDDERVSAWNMVPLLYYFNGKYEKVDQVFYFFNEDNGHMLITDDQGDTWNTSALDLNEFIRGTWYGSEYPQSGEIIIAPDRSTIFLLYPGNGIIASTDNGKTWGHFDDGIDTELVYQIAFSPSDPSVMYAATENGLYRCDTPVVISENITSVAYDPAPSAYPVIANHPNPFNPTTTITYTLPEPGMVSLSVYSVTGQMVATLVDEPIEAGTHAVQFDGSGLASGVYFARLEAGNAVETRKMLLVK